MIDGVVTSMLIGVLTMSSRSGIGRRDKYCPVASVVTALGAGVHTVSDIDPWEPANMPFLLACEWIQASPQSVWLNNVASQNM